MNANFFLDTNILVYVFDPHDPMKQQRARQLVAHAVETELGCVSYQVMQELLNVMTKKGFGPSTRTGVSLLFEKYLTPLCRAHSSTILMQRAFDLHARWQYSFYDSLIIAAALQADCVFLYSEDLQHNQKIESLSIINPFLIEPDEANSTN